MLAVKMTFGSGPTRPKARRFDKSSPFVVFLVKCLEFSKDIDPKLCCENSIEIRTANEMLAVKMTFGSGPTRPKARRFDKSSPFVVFLVKCLEFSKDIEENR